MIPRVKPVGELEPKKLRLKMDMFPVFGNVKIPSATGQTFEVDINDILSLTKGKHFSEITALEAISLLEKVSRWRAFIWSGYIILKERRMKAEDDYDVWFADRWRESERSLRERNQQEVRDGLRSKTEVRPSREEVVNYIRSVFVDQYRIERERSRAAEIRERKLYGIYQAIDKFGTELATVVREGSTLLWRLT